MMRVFEHASYIHISYTYVFTVLRTKYNSSSIRLNRSIPATAAAVKFSLSFLLVLVY